MKKKSNYHKAILLTSYKDVNLLKKDSNIVGIAGAYPIIQQSESLDMDYFLDYPEIAVDFHNLVGEVVSGWYRNKNGFSVFGVHDVSIGAILSYKLAIEFSSALRYYFAFKEYVPKYEKILVSHNIPSSLNLAAKYFSNRIDFFHSENQFDEHITSSPNRGRTRNPPIHNFLSICLRFLQRPFLKYIKNKVLIINDWTYRKLNNPDCLNINKLNPLRTFCLRGGYKYLSLAERLFPEEIDTDSFILNIQRILSEFDIDNKIKRDLTGLFIQVLHKEYIESRDKLINTYCAYNEMFDYYSPLMIVVPGYAHTFYQTIFGIAKSRKVPTMLIQDGNFLCNDKYLFPKDMHSKKQMIDYFTVPGSYVGSLYKGFFNSNNIKTINILPPIIKTHKFGKNKEIIKSAIVMFPYGMVHSPYCRWDQKYKYVIDVVNTLDDLGYKSIKIKMKEGQDPYKEKENQLMRTLLNNYNHAGVEMIFGEFSDYLNSAEFVIGYISAGTIESIYRDVPYYIYEPQSLGMTDSFIKKSSIIDRNQIARDLVHLKKLISNNNFVLLDKDKIFDGIDIDEIDFMGIAKRFHSNSLSVIS
tara:strand:- start:1388 stop:3136 length:1749 start_codon:yes stop_codon:yes gene_type:complete